MATGQNIADEVRTQLNDGDAAALRWSDAEILSYINAALREIVLLVPEANVADEVVSTVNDFKQTLPARGTKFLDVWNVEE